MKLYACLVSALFFLGSCIVRAPRYTRAERVFQLELGETPEEVTNTLGTVPYYMSALNDSEMTVLYKYRVTDRVTVPFLMHENNGKKVKGKYVNLLVTYDKHYKAKRFVSCQDCDVTSVEKNKLDMNKVITFLTVTLPVIAVYFGIRLGAQSK